MSEKPKITMKELQDIYDIEDSKHIPEKESKIVQNSEFEEYTEKYDKKEEEELNET